MNDKPIPPAVAEFAVHEIDNLRARLAKYEDADGNPASTIAEQAREIERLEAEIEDTLIDWGQIRLELAALKAQPSGVDERAAFEAWYLGHFYMGDKQCGLEWLSTEPCGGYRHQHPAEQWIVWQARAALSANHSEQVRAVPVKPTEAMRKAAQDKLASEGLIVTDWLIHTAYSAMLAAAPSAGSQEQG